MKKTVWILVVVAMVILALPTITAVECYDVTCYTDLGHDITWLHNDTFTVGADVAMTSHTPDYTTGSGYLYTSNPTYNVVTAGYAESTSSDDGRCVYTNSIDVSKSALNDTNKKLVVLFDIMKKNVDCDDISSRIQFGHDGSDACYGSSTDGFPMIGSRMGDCGANGIWMHNGSGGSTNVNSLTAPTDGVYYTFVQEYTWNDTLHVWHVEYDYVLNSTNATLISTGVMSHDLGITNSIDNNFSFSTQLNKNQNGQLDNLYVFIMDTTTAAPVTPTIEWVEYDTYNNTLQNTAVLELGLNLTDHDPLANITIYNNSLLYTTLTNVNTSEIAKLNLTTESHYVLKANTTVQTQLLDITIDRTNGSITFGTLIEYYIGQTIDINLTCQDSNLYGCNYSLHDPNGVMVNWSEAVQLSGTSHTLSNTSYLGTLGSWTLTGFVSDDHTILDIPEYLLENVTNGVRFNNEVRLTRSGAKTTPIVTKHKDRYSYAFPNPTGSFYDFTITTTLPINRRMSSPFQGHIVLGEGLGKYWIDFENDEGASVTFVSQSRGSIRFRTNATTFRSIGGVNIYGESTTFTVLNINNTIISPTNGSSVSNTTITGICVDHGTGILNATSNDSTFINYGNVTHYAFSDNEAGNASKSYGLVISCENNAGFVENQSLIFSYSPSSSSVSLNTTLVTGECPSTLESISVLALFIIIAFVFVFVGYTLKIPFVVMCGGAILVFSYFQLGVCATLLAIPVPLAGLMICVWSVIHRFD